MALEYELAAPGTDVDVMNNYYVYLRRDADTLYYDSDDSTFKAFGSLVDGQLELTEDGDQPGLWQLTLTVPGTETGTFTIIPRDGQTDLLIVEGVQRVYLVNSEPTRSLIDAEIFLHDQFSGLDNYQLLDPEGAPVEGATVRVFTKALYDANDLTTPIGVTFTDGHGYWLDPIPVTPGDTYTVAFHKTGVVGPTSVEIVIP
jgi:hypothetical protein